MALNKVSIMGRITGDLELKHVGANGDIPTVSFGIACPRDFKNKGTGENETDFFNRSWQTALIHLFPPLFISISIPYKNL